MMQVFSTCLPHPTCRLDSELRPTDAGEGHPVCTSTPPSDITLVEELTFTVDLPGFPENLDFGLIVDVSGSYRCVEPCFGFLRSWRIRHVASFAVNLKVSPCNLDSATKHCCHYRVAIESVQ